MNTFVNAVITQESRTENGMKAKKSTTSALVDFFFKAGAMRGQDIVPTFVAAYTEDQKKALRLALWLRDIREGAGERELFKCILQWLEKYNPEHAKILLTHIPELGRWDDIFAFQTSALKFEAYGMLALALMNKNGLAAKWCPRQGPIAAELRTYIGMSPKQFRKTLVGLTNVVEQQMCSNDWDNIEFSKVPSLASARYKKAFNRHTPKFQEYVDKLSLGDKEVKVNTGAVYPYDVLKGLKNSNYSSNELKHVIAQWEALPNYIGSASILPMVDVSGSMDQPAGNSKTVTAMDVALSLGLYCSEKNVGKFKDLFVTFAEHPSIEKLEGNIVERFSQLKRADWNTSTNLHLAIETILSTALNGKVPKEEMPEVLLILSDMQFDECMYFDDSAMEMIARKYSQYGYVLPKIIFWNIAAHSNVPVVSTQHGVALISGFSPAILKSILLADLNSMTPENIMLQTIMKDRYKV